MIIKDNNMCPFYLKYRKTRLLWERSRKKAKYPSVVENIPNGHITCQLSVEAEDDGEGHVNMAGCGGYRERVKNARQLLAGLQAEEEIKA
jgi:hypothetical protein